MNPERSSDSTGTLRYYSLKHLIPKEHQDFSLVHRIAAVNEGIVFQTGKQLFLYKNDGIDVLQPSTANMGFHFAHALAGGEVTILLCK